jgi:hypothetical protein
MIPADMDKAKLVGPAKYSFLICKNRGFLISLFLTMGSGEDFSRPSAGKIYFN